MSRQVVFRYYPWIAIVGAIACVLVVLMMATENRVPLVGSVIVVALGFCYFAQQQKLAEISLFKELFIEFNRRYDGLNDHLGQVAMSATLGVGDRQAVVDYFNLCAEEYLFFSEGYIHREAWRSWCRGMLWYFDREPFKSVWKEEGDTNSYYGLCVEAIRRGAA